MQDFQRRKTNKVNATITPDFSTRRRNPSESQRSTELRVGDWSSGSSGFVEQSIGVELATQKNRKIALWKVSFGVLVSLGKHYTIYMKNPFQVEVGLSGKEQLQSPTRPHP